MVVVMQIVLIIIVSNPEMRRNRKWSGAGDFLEGTKNKVPHPFGAGLRLDVDFAVGVDWEAFSASGTFEGFDFGMDATEMTLGIP